MRRRELFKAMVGAAVAPRALLTGGPQAFQQWRIAVVGSFHAVGLERLRVVYERCRTGGSDE